MVPKLRGWKKPQEHQRAYGYSAGLCQCGAGRKALSGGSGRGGDRNGYRRTARGKGSYRWNRRGRKLQFEYQCADRRERSQGYKAGGRDHQRLHQYDRCFKDPHDEGVWGIDGFQDPGSCGKRQLQKVPFRGIYLQICQDLYACRLLQRPGAGDPPAGFSDAVFGPSCRLGHVDLPGADLPCNQLSLCPCNQHSLKLFCRNRRRQQGRNFGKGFQLPGDPFSDQVRCIR